MFTKERTNKPVDFFAKGKKGEKGNEVCVCVDESILRKGMMKDEEEGREEKYNAIMGIQRYL